MSENNKHCTARYDGEVIRGSTWCKLHCYVILQLWLATLTVCMLRVGLFFILRIRVGNGKVANNLKILVSLSHPACISSSS